MQKEMLAYHLEFCLYIIFWSDGLYVKGIFVYVIQLRTFVSTILYKSKKQSDDLEPPRSHQVVHLVIIVVMLIIILIRIIILIMIKVKCVKEFCVSGSGSLEEEPRFPD